MKNLKSVLAEVKMATMSEATSGIRGKLIDVSDLDVYEYTNKTKKLDYKTLINMDRKLKFLSFDNPDENGLRDITELTWKQFKQSDLPYLMKTNNEKDYVNRLLAQIKQFNRRVEAKGVIKKMNDFSEKVDYLLKLDGVKAPKKGI